jgi:hypothetical protein
LSVVADAFCSELAAGLGVQGCGTMELLFSDEFTRFPQVHFGN